MDKILKTLTIVIYGVFASVLMFYSLMALSFMFKGKNSNAIQEILVFIQHIILPISFYIIGAVALGYNKTWSWGFILIGGIIVIMLNLSVIPMRSIHIGIYLLSFITYLVNTAK